jgi:iron complex outermembrane receptor protein
VGENGIRDAQARIGWGDDRGTFRLNTDRRSDDGLTGANGHNQVSRLNARADLYPVPGDELQIRLGAASLLSGKGFAGKVDNNWRDARFDSSYAQLDYKRTLNVDADLSLKLSHSQEEYQDEYPYSLLPFGINDVYMVRGSGQASSDSLTLQYTQRFSDTLRTVSGGEFRSERIVSSALYDTDAAFVTDFTRLFGNVEWRVSPTWLVNAGAMAERSNVTGTTVAPRVMLNWHLAPGQTLRAGVSKAFRPASNYENFANLRFVWNGQLLGINTLGRGNVQPETVVAQEIGYLGDFPKQGWSVDVRLFREQIDGFIRQYNRSGIRYYLNEEDFPIHGVEYQVKWRLWPGGQLVWNQSYVNIDAALTRPGGIHNEFSGTSMAAPALASSLVYSQKISSDWDVMLAHHDQGTAVASGSGVGSQVAITRTDFRLAKALRWGESRGEVSLVVQNLGVPYPDFDPAFSFQRRAFVTLRLDN